jgi:hypothetical protein
MSAETVGMHMPAMVTLDDLAAMNASDPRSTRCRSTRKLPGRTAWFARPSWPPGTHRAAVLRT